MMRIARRPPPSAISPKFELSLPQRQLTPMEVIRVGPDETSYGLATSKSSSSGLSSTPVTNSALGGGGLQLQQNQQQPSQTLNPANGEQKPAAWSPYAPSEIAPHLFLGGQDNAQSAGELAEFDIRRILNVAEECENNVDLLRERTIVALHIPIRDHSDENIAEYFDQCVEFIRDSVCRGENILVHCRFGVSRSATMVIAYLMRYGVDPTHPKPMSYEDAFDTVKSKRPHISPNLGFVLALKEIDAASTAAPRRSDTTESFEK